MDIFKILLKYDATLKVKPVPELGEFVKVTISNNEYVFNSFIDVKMYSTYFKEVLEQIGREFVKEMGYNT